MKKPKSKPKSKLAPARAVSEPMTNIQILLRVPVSLADWLSAQVEARGRGSRQDVILDQLTKIKQAEEQKAS